MRKTETDRLLDELNKLNGKVYPNVGYFYFADIVGDGRNIRSVYQIVGPNGGVAYAHELNGRPAQRCARIREAVLRIKIAQGLEAIAAAASGDVRPADPLEGMTQARWDALEPIERAKLVDTSDLHPMLRQRVGYRVRALLADGSSRTFIVGKTTGWRPSLLALRSRTQRGSSEVIRPDMPIVSVSELERVR